jgi:protein O-mannosyl-transferase
MRLGRALAVLTLVAATAATFWPVQLNGFVNWDDPDVLVANAHLRRPLASLLTWAFTTTHMDHYQPLSWLAFAGLADATPARFHAVSLALHLLNVTLRAWLSARVADPGAGDGSHWWAAAAATAVFAVHPLRVEPVAWASALPYLLSYAPLLASVGCWVAWTRDRRWPTHLWWAALVLYAVSQLARVTAPFLPVVLFVVTRADERARPFSPRDLMRALAPFAAVAVPLAVLEAGARNVEALSDIGLGPRVTWVLQHPGLYAWRTLWPMNLSPLDVLPRDPRPDPGLALLFAIGAAIVVALTRHFTSWRLVAAVWGSYLLLLLPVLGLTPSGLQVTADRYTYGPAMVLTLALAVLLTRVPQGGRRAGLVAAGAAAVFLSQAATAQTAYWRDSVTLWSRAVALDGNNDVALYNLAQALTTAGLPDAAAQHYERLVALVPDHELGRQALQTIQADKAPAAADAAAQAGSLNQAVTGYDRVLALDPGRVQALVNRGMARIGLGDIARGVPDLEAAVQAGNQDPAVASALAFGWVSMNRAAEAIALLTRMRAEHPNDVGLASNLARLLLTAEPASLRDPANALAIAARFTQMTGGRDPRLLDTLAMAFTAAGQPVDARQALERAVSLARDAGDADLTATLARRLAALPR